MHTVFFMSSVFVFLALVPLWWDAHLRPEYGKRPFYMLLSLLAFILPAMGAAGVWLAVPEIGGFFVAGITSFLVSFQFLALFLMEYSVHHQRIFRNHLEKAYQQGSVKILVLAGAALLLSVLILGVLSYIYTLQSQKISFRDTITGIMELGAMACLILASGFTISLNGMQGGVIRRTVYPFVTFVVLSLVVVAAGFVKEEFGMGLSFAALLGFNLLYAVRTYHEYFMYRMHHLSDTNRRQMEIDSNRTRLINQVLVSDSADDQLIIKTTLESFMAQLVASTPSKTQSFKSAMIMQRSGDMLAVLSPDFILNFCAPLVASENLKRMNPEELKKHILAQTFNLAELESKAAGTESDFAAEAVRKLAVSRQPVVIDPLPQGLKTMYRLIVLYPVLNQDKLIGAAVLYKDASDHVLPSEDVIIRAMTGNLSIIMSIMAGKQVQQEKNRLSGEMDTAKNIQTSILPRKIELPGYETSASMVTASEVGGDLYDFVANSQGNYLDIGDVSGHGLPSGLMALIHMAAFQGALYCSETLKQALAANQLYDIVNKTLVSINRDRIGSDKFMTCNILTEKAGTFSHAGAHLAAVVYRAAARKAEELPGMTDRTAFLGISEFIQSESSLGSFSLASGDILCLYTDGLIEARNRDGKFFGLESVTEILERHAAEPLDAIRAHMITALETFAASGDLKKHEGKFADDVTLVFLRRQ